MLAGEQLFQGETMTDVLAAVVTKEPDLNRAPVKVRRLLRRCLEKDPRRRLRDIGEARFLLEEGDADVRAQQIKAPTRKAAWTMAAVFLLAFVAVAFVHYREKALQVQALQYTLAPPEKSRVDSFALSPDGHYLAMATSGDHSQLWVRALDSLRAQTLAGTEGASYPFWSPDSRYIGFFAQGKLKKIAVTGGPAQILCDAPLGSGGTWNSEGVIVFAPTNFGGLSRVLATGGVPEQARKAEVGGGHRFPVFLPDGRHFLYRAVGTEETGIYYASLDGSEKRRILLDSVNPQYLPPILGAKDGYLFFVRETTLMAQPVDPRSMEAKGDAFAVAEPVFSFSTSRNGIVIYQSGGAAIRELQYAWFDRTGKELGVIGGRVRTRFFALSPDGKRVVIERVANPQGNLTDLWVTDLERGTESRLTFDTSINENPVWSPNGDRVVFSSTRRGVYNLYERAANGSGQDQIVFQSQENNFAVDWSRDGRFIIFQTTNLADGKVILWALPVTRDKKPIRLQGQGNMFTGKLSPDSRWLAFVSDVSGRNEVYVIPFSPEDSAPGKQAGGKWQISLSGGGQPQWRGDGRELFYLSTDGRLMSAEVKAGSEGFEWATPQPLFELRVDLATTSKFLYRYAPAPDGKRFLVSTEPDTLTDSPPLTVLVNWTAGSKFPSVVQ
jgi:Tol biopolymer transport system component